MDNLIFNLQIGEEENSLFLLFFLMIFLISLHNASRIEIAYIFYNKNWFMKGGPEYEKISGSRRRC